MEKKKMVSNYSAKKAFCLDFSRNCRALLECLTLYKKQDLEKEGVNIAGTEWSEWTGGERLEFGCV